MRGLPPRHPKWVRHTVVAVVIALVALGLDRLTKVLAVQHLEPLAGRSLIGNLITLKLTYNSGAAFSMGSGSTWIFTIVSLVVSVAVIAYLPWVRRSWSAAVLGLLLGGAVGNLVDRFTQPPHFGVGHVIDFINYHDLFIGNVADIWIVVAALLLVLGELVSSRGDQSSSGRRGPNDQVFDSRLDDHGELRQS